jgi:hypothetical protein
LRIDDTTAQYMIEARPLFEDLRQTVAQLAGVLVLAATGAKAAAEPALTAPAVLLEETVEGLRALRVPPRAHRHHHHLVAAAAAVTRALALARHESGHAPIESTVDAALACLREGYDELEQAGRTLPGFEMVAFERACCAAAVRSVP